MKTSLKSDILIGSRICRWRLITSSGKFPSMIDNENIDELIFISLTWNLRPTGREKISTILDLFMFFEKCSRIPKWLKTWQDYKCDLLFHIFFIKSWGSTSQNLKTGSIKLKALFCLFSFLPKKNSCRLKNFYKKCERILFYLEQKLSLN